jgi:DNA-binding response OmpR family regulator
MATKSTNADRSEATPSKTVEVAKMKVLVADGDPRILTFLNNFLTARGYQPILAPSGVEMLEQIKTRQPDIAVIGDFKTKESSILNLLRGVRASSNLPVIILSAFGKDQHRIDGINLGADDYMSKPFNPTELHARINAVLRRTGSSVSREESVKAKLDSLVLTDADTVKKWARDLLRKKEGDKPK